ncbi:MAG: c-type cytochrome [Chloroflexota bacterium]
MTQINKRRRFLFRLIIINVALLIASFFWYARQENRIQLAVAKSGQNFYSYSLPGAALDRVWVRNIALTNVALNQLLAETDYTFVEAVRLTTGEARAWADLGCGADDCALATFYNFDAGGTIEAVVNLETAVTVAFWQNPLARPAGSSLIAAKVLDIAAADAEVQALLGDIRAEEQVMVPMSGWLVDDACRDQWCVDLTYHDPAGSGRIVHVFVNVEQERVARIFYTRGRANQPTSAIPPMQRYAYTDDCKEQDGWSVCWEMTAHDGILFRDATYNGNLVFASAKISQVEAWYPSWPGGYRDEIGFNASVPPFGGTQITDLADGFEVRQLFTEFTHWPNCICCYRYEQVMQFFADGSFSPQFVSHGPGCDDLSIYRPFWRIDMDIDGPEGDHVAVWQDGEWREAETEFELYPVVDDVAPDGTKLGTFDGDTLYTWQMARTDPLGLDEARLFVLQKKEEEGDGPIATGPGDTFQPPRQWLDGEPISGQNIVVWFVPLLKTKKSNPLWCMPDPEPGINQCTAVLRIAPATELRQPTVTEIEEARATPKATVTATAVPTPAPTATPRPVQGDDAADIILNSGCGACHTIGALGEARKVGPDLTHIADTAGERVPGLSAAEYIRQSILEPNAFIAPACPNGPCLENIMPRDYRQRLSDEQIDLIVDFLLTKVATAVAPTAIGANTSASTPKAQPAAKTTPILPQTTNTPLVAIQILLVTLVLLLTLFRLTKE